MYAALKIRINRATGAETVYAWKLETAGTKIIIHLDDPEDESSYPAPNGTLELHTGTPFTVLASY